MRFVVLHGAGRFPDLKKVSRLTWAQAYSGFLNWASLGVRVDARFQSMESPSCNAYRADCSLVAKIYYERIQTQADGDLKVRL